jgi:hypothetical protein
MRTVGALLAASALALSACSSEPDTEMIPSGGAAADLGPGYCESTPPPEEEERWNEVCFPGR